MYLGIFISAMTLCTDIFHCAFCFLYDGTSCKGRLQVILRLNISFVIVMVLMKNICICNAMYVTLLNIFLFLIDDLLCLHSENVSVFSEENM